ncbi:hypothetical protein IQ37_05485 [Chryseobacterium piperi]|uniref:Uncharacterized protein n=1 Tax=Chryseobacterium piperi TaxID=558152 RepID=A0A086BKK8_9FLAO|nr:hypothetical protein [Chryseobacterium piperi]ASW72906.1 hypothetical protein CJF12_00440 [Chryseobacterium piperi]KFF29472.1 hypothetical protein IQ37_05485 [Chryseobacterium piperi]
MLHKTILFSLGMLALTNCSAQKEKKTTTNSSASASTTDTKTMNKEGDIMYFTEGENRFLKEYQMNVTFNTISEDSRCPEGVNCIWAGVAVANITVMGVATRPVTLSLATTDNPGRNYTQSAPFNGYTISLTNVTPYPTEKEGTKALSGKYKIGITIKKTGENPTTK